MTTDDERRRVARILRGGYDVSSDACGRFWLNGTLFGLNIMARSEERIRDGLSRLADLIEPSDHIGDSDKMVDREALLALADELEEDACWEVQSPGVDNRAWMLKDVCDRIREACGEVVG